MAKLPNYVLQGWLVYIPLTAIRILPNLKICNNRQQGESPHFYKSCQVILLHIRTRIMYNNYCCCICQHAAYLWTVPDPLLNLPTMKKYIIILSNRVKLVPLGPYLILFNAFTLSKQQ